MTRITNTMAKKIIKDIHLKRIDAINKYFEMKTKELEESYKNKLNIPSDIKEKTKQAEELLNNIFKYYNINISFPKSNYEGQVHEGSIKMKNYLDNTNPNIPIKIELTDKKITYIAFCAYDISAKYKKEYIKSINDEKEAYKNIIDALKGIRKEQIIIDIVKEGYDVDLEKYKDKMVEKKPEIKQFKFNKEFCKIIEKNNN